MAERPILFSGEMVRAILAGTKTQTRRPVRSPARTMQREGMEVIKHREPGDPWYRDCVWSMRGRTGVWGDYKHADFMALCPFGRPGDVLWVRETWACPQTITYYRADEEDLLPVGEKWCPSIHMPRWAARIWLRVTDVRVERVQDITEEDARAEGVTPRHVSPSGWIHRGESHVEAFSSAWAAIYGAESWNRNDWVWRIAFERCESPAREGGNDAR